MIEEEYITVKTARLLAQAGLPRDKFTNYTQAQAMRWLRENCRLFVRISPNMAAFDPTKSCYWEVDALNVGGCDILEADIADTYEHAAEAGIQAACICLIRNNQP